LVLTPDNVDEMVLNELTAYSCENMKKVIIGLETDFGIFWALCTVPALSTHLVAGTWDREQLVVWHQGSGSSMLGKDSGT